MNRQRLILFFLLIAFACAVAWSIYAFPRQKSVSPAMPAQTAQQRNTSSRKAVSLQAISAKATDPRVLNIALLNVEQSGFKGYRRDIFKPIFIDEIRAMKEKASAVKPPRIITPPIQKPVVEEKKELPMLKAEPLRELARFTFLGFLKRDNQKTIFLARDKDILLVKQGDKIAGKYEASSITDQALTIIALETGDEIVVPLIESKPLVSVK